MSKHVLIKLSSPGWEKTLHSESAARDELYKHICEQCRIEEGITKQSKIDDMLGTACGYEFDYEVNK